MIPSQQNDFWSRSFAEMRLKITQSRQFHTLFGASDLSSYIADKRNCNLLLTVETINHETGYSSLDVIKNHYKSRFCLSSTLEALESVAASWGASVASTSFVHFSMSVIYIVP